MHKMALASASGRGSHAQPANKNIVAYRMCTGGGVCQKLKLKEPFWRDPLQSQAAWRLGRGWIEGSK